MEQEKQELFEELKNIRELVQNTKGIDQDTVLSIERQNNFTSKLIKEIHDEQDIISIRIRMHKLKKWLEMNFIGKRKEENLPTGKYY